MMTFAKSAAAFFGGLMLVGGVTATTDVQAAEEITFGTLSPASGPFHKVFKKWSKAVKKKTKGAVNVKWHYNGTMGGEKAMIAKMRAGQLDGAAVTAVGLGSIHQPFLAFQMPGLIDSWKTLAKVRKAMMPGFKKAAAGKGVLVLGDANVGLAHTMSKGKAIRTPDDLKTMKVYRSADDPVGPITASVIGYTAVPSSVPGLKPALSSGRVNVITVPALAATLLQWGPHLDHINKDVAGVGIGGLVFSASKLESLGADTAKVIKKTGKRAGRMLGKRIEKEDKKAYKKLAKKMTVVELSAAEKKVWRDTMKKVRRRLGEGTFPSSLVSKMEALAGK